ncbi:MAG: NAD(P)-dependent oxidoreductase [Pararhodobacter sp.]|nr:NAD(P)-dependent oxidoreductase [Pararhodobacter sp.]
MAQGAVFVTGGSGFLGQALITALTARGRQVVSFDLAPPRGTAAPKAPGVITVQGDIRDPDSVMRAVLDHGASDIVHLAAMVIPACREKPVLGAEVNMIGHINVLEAARAAGIGPVVYTSSIAARPRPPLDSPANLYGVYKRCCEEISKVYFMDHGVASIGLRPNVVYGPGREIGETAFVTHAMRAAAERKRYAFPFSGAMCFQHVDEVTDIFLRCLDAKPEKPVVSDLTTETNTTDEVIAAIRRVVPDADLIASDTPRMAPSGLDNTPLRTLLGSWARVDLDEGTRRTIAHFRQLTGQ